MRAQGLFSVHSRVSLSRSLRTTRAAPAASAAAMAPLADAWSKIHGLKVIRSSDGEAVDLTTLWGPGERAVVAFTRSFG
ncbi:hypothetical protein V8C86DRAFT_2727021 [Haematococcus lacustris]